MESVKKYFKTLTDEQLRQFAMLDELYHEWNAKINVISRKDIDNLYEHHVLHSLAIAKAANFRAGTEILDLVRAAASLVCRWPFCFRSAASS